MSLQKRGPHKKLDKVIKFHFGLCSIKLKYHLYAELNISSHIKEQLFGNKTVVTCGIFFKSGITQRGIKRNPRVQAPFLATPAFIYMQTHFS